MNPARLAEALAAKGEPPFRLTQILTAVYRDGAASYADISTLPRALREVLDQAAPIQSLAEKQVLVSQDGRARKAVLTLKDGLAIETVLLKPVPGDAWTTCISCQVGCAVGCTFCATGLMGLKRTLTVEEVVDQVAYWRQHMKREGVPGRLTNVVYMGMGEPFHCYDVVAESIRALTDPERLGLAQRHVSVSTSGLVPGIEKFADDFPQVNLALSLHAGEDRLRTKLVPVNKAYPIEKLVEAVRRYLDKTNRKIFIEYVLLARENDSLDHADQVVTFARKVGKPHLLHVNLIVWNPTNTAHAPAAAAQATAFRDRLRAAGIPVTIRKNLGQDIQGACGQLIA